MERVTFLLERSGERIPCLLNPESFQQSRTAGVRSRRSLSGVVTGAEHADHPLLFTGGGRTEIEFDLLFDVSLVRPPRQIVDVRELTTPLWNLAENDEDERGRPRPPIVRFLWGTTWNVPGVVVAVAERLEYFTPDGVPRRSWLRMRFLRIAEAASPPVNPPASPAELLEVPESDLPLDEELPADTPGESHIVVGGPPATAEEVGGERLDVIAAREYGDPALWRALALFNRIADPLRIAVGTRIRLPTLASLLRRP